MGVHDLTAVDGQSFEPLHAVGELERPFRCTVEHEVAVGTGVAVSDQRLHHAQERHLVGIAGVVVGQPVKLPHADLHRPPGPDAVVQLVQIAGDRFPMLVVLVDHPPAFSVSKATA